MYHSFLIHLSADGHLGCFHVLAIINSALFLWLPASRWTCDYLAAAAAKSLQSCPTLCDPIDGSPPGQVGCHFYLQCMKVKSESEVAQWCLTLSDPMDCSLPGCPVHGIFQATVLE